MKRPETRRLTPLLAACASAVLQAGLAVPAGAQVRLPGPESFAVEPKTPMETWEAIDYLVRSGQARLAVPYLEAFLKGNPDDATLIAIREQYGFGSVLRLGDDPATAAYTRPLLDRIGEAVRRKATEPTRIEAAIDDLTKTVEEQNYGVQRLRQAGPYAVPPLVRRLGAPGLEPEDRALIVSNMGRLDASAVPALVAVLDAPDSSLAADAADVLGRIGDRRAVPDLTFLAASPETNAGLRETAGRAIERLTGRPFDQQRQAPARLLTEQAWRYHRHQVQFPDGPVGLWTWQGDAPALSTMSATEAESMLGLRRAREALGLEPGDVSAQAALISLALEKAAEGYGPQVVATQDPTGAFALAVGAGPSVLGEVVRTAIADSHPTLASIASLALGRVTDRDGLAVEGRFSPLVEALAAPDRRVQFAAAAALVGLDPIRPFSGSSGVVPVLARFINGREEPRAVVIDGNARRAGGVAGALRTLGYEPEVAASGREGFNLAAESAAVELVLLDPGALQGPWRWQDTVVNLRADARTAGLPIFVIVPTAPESGLASARANYGLTTGNIETVVEAHRASDRIAATLANYPRTATVVATEDPQALRSMLERDLARMGARPLSAEERRAYARAASVLLARIASTPGSPFEGQLARAEPDLSAAALANPEVSPAASRALAGVPRAQAQQSLADLLLDPSRPAPLRLSAGNELARSVQQFGPLLTPEQERRLLDEVGSESDPALRSVLAAVLGALRPEPEAVGARLRTFIPSRAPAPGEAAPPESGAGEVPPPDSDVPPPTDAGAIPPAPALPGDR